MYKLNLKYANKIIYSKDVIIDNNNERLHDIINKFVRDNIHEIKNSISESNDYYYLNSVLSTEDKLPFFIYLEPSSNPLNYDLDENGLLYIHSSTLDGLWSINSINKLRELQLVKWEGREITFSIALGIGAGGAFDTIVETFINILTSQPVTAIIAAKELVYFSVEGIKKLRKFSSKDSKNILRKTSQGWIKRGIYPRQLKDIILTSRQWNKEDLKRLFGTDETTVIAIMYSLGYKIVDRNTFEIDNSEEAIKFREKWDERINQ